ncbi:hypothetical protein FRAAL2417 [Frankia alni ACN14a]|uniref:Uncharacterized protein n=1 Tax=Frankia alni (strain DSM 45986 / CECT 9034 / ACN14a) TaxID=326424 RepID=Q0RN27_FRAAA|nr:hypothetical protein FRAAL2417 [Frankia alni ACN14a]
MEKVAQKKIQVKKNDRYLGTLLG